MKCTLLIDILTIESKGEFQHTIESILQIIADNLNREGHKFDVGYNPNEITDSFNN